MNEAILEADPLAQIKSLADVLWLRDESYTNTLVQVKVCLKSIIKRTGGKEMVTLPKELSTHKSEHINSVMF